MSNKRDPAFEGLPEGATLQLDSPTREPTPEHAKLQADSHRTLVMAHLLGSLENWRGCMRIQVAEQILMEEEKELKHAYDLFQREIAKIEKAEAN